MLKKTSISLNATSRVNDTDIANFNASFMAGENANFNISKNAYNMQMYEANQSVVDSDYAEFEAWAKDCASKIFGKDTESEETL